MMMLTSIRRCAVAIAVAVVCSLCLTTSSSVMAMPVDGDEHPMHKMIEDDKIADLRAALDGKTHDINHVGPGGQTPIMFATLQGKLKAFKILLAAGADVTIGEAMGYTPIHGCGFQGRAAICKLLIDSGVDPVDYHRDGYLPIHRAAWGKEDRHTDTVEVFLEAKVDPDLKSRNDKPRTAMWVTPNQATYRLLEAHGATEENRPPNMEEIRMRMKAEGYYDDDIERATQEQAATAGHTEL